MSLSRFLMSLSFIGLTAAMPVHAKPSELHWILDNAKPLKTYNTTASATSYLGQKAVKVELTDTLQKQVMQQQAGNPFAMALVPVKFKNGVIEVEIAAEVNGKGAPDARGFAGLAFHVNPQRQSYDAIYLRMTNGRLAQPVAPEPRIERAIQYVAKPNWDFSVFREKFPGQYEKGANVAPKTWIRYRIEVNGNQARAYVNGESEPSLVINDIKHANQLGAIGLWVDDGTSAYFRNLKVIPR
jgi:hypothetical protein